jgi:hypothetical protein
MSIRKLIYGGGELDFEGSFLSARIVKEALEKKYQIIPIEELTHYLRFRIIRFRLFVTFLCPHAQIEITITRNNRGFTLSWLFYWPEYYIPLILYVFFLIFFVLARDSQGISGSLVSPAFPAMLWGFLIFLDCKRVSRGVRKAFEYLQRQSLHQQL